MIKTERLILRNLKKSDAPSIAKYANDYEVSKWLAKMPYPYTVENANWWINHANDKAKEIPRTDYTFGIDLNGEIIGGIGIHEISDRIGEVGYWIGREHWQKGYGSEALKAIVDYASDIGLRGLYAKVYVGNPSSGKLLEKCGFKQDKSFKGKVICKADGIEHDDLKYDLQLAKD
jgi:[ribosomal protein S5]-alanine N-acetyltransferase